MVICAIQHLVPQFLFCYLLLCHSYLCNRGNSYHVYSIIINVINKQTCNRWFSHGYFTFKGLEPDSLSFYRQILETKSRDRIEIHLSVVWISFPDFALGPKIYTVELLDNAQHNILLVFIIDFLISQTNGKHMLQMICNIHIDILLI